MSYFTSLGLTEKIQQAIRTEGYDTPTPIQAEVIPALMKGRDVVGIAQTGTGKTAAFVLPILHRIATEDMRPAPKCCRALILAPTRELAAQIADSIRAYGQHMRHSVAVVVGGVKPAPQIRAVARGVDIIVATPGRLEDHISGGVISLKQTDMIVLDEADQMMDMGFLPAMRRIMSKLPKRRQTMLLSATMPKQIRSLANDFLRDPAEISVAPQSKPIERIDQKVYLIDKPSKRGQLIEILRRESPECAIVFTRTKHGADKVTRHLDKEGFLANAIHGNKSQGQRVKTLAAFKAGNINILVATDIAARGIDIDGVSHVINFELPNVPEAYVHRIGRTARAGRSGVAISLCDGSEISYLRDIEKLTKCTIQRVEVSMSGMDDEQLNDIAVFNAAPRSKSRTSVAVEQVKLAQEGAGKKRRRRKPAGSSAGVGAGSGQRQGQGQDKAVTGGRAASKSGQKPGSRPSGNRGNNGFRGKPGNRSKGGGRGNPRAA